MSIYKYKDTIKNLSKAHDELALQNTDLYSLKQSQGCALTAPGSLRRLTFGFGRMRKTTRSPGQALWLIVSLADKGAKNFNMLVVTVYKTSQKMFFLRTKQSVQRPFHTISLVT